MFGIFGEILKIIEKIAMTNPCRVIRVAQIEEFKARTLSMYSLSIFDNISSIILKDN